MRYAAKKDSTHNSIERIYKNCFWQILDTSKAGKYGLDFLAKKAGEIRWIECKSGNKPLTESQEKLFCYFADTPMKCRKIRSVEEAIQDAIK